MLPVKIFIFILFFITTFQSYYFSNIYFSISYEGFIITSRARYGFSYLAFSKQNNSFENALILMNYYNQNQMNTIRFEGNKTLNISKKVIPLGDLFQSVNDISGYPLGRFLNDQTITFMFNTTNFHSNFSLPLWVFVGVNLNQLPNSPVRFIDKFDESQWIYLDTYSNKMKEMPIPELRLESLHVSIYVITLVYFIIVLIMAIWYTKYQPLKSRGIIPRIIPVVMFVDLFFDFFRFCPFYFFQFYFIIRYLIKEPLILALLIILLLRFGRYLILFYLNERKENAYFRKDNQTKMQLKFKILKHLGRWYSVISIYFMLYFFIFLFYFMMVLILFLTNNDIDIVRIINIFLELIVMLLNLFVLIFDFIRNIILSKSLRLFKKDTLYFRLEFYIIENIANFIFVIFIIISHILLYVKSSINSSFTFINIMLTLAYQSIIFKNVLLVVFLTIYNLLKTNNTEINKMIKLLNNETAKTYFIEYSKSEFSLENASSYYDIKSYQEELDFSRREKMAIDMFNLYFNGNNSELEVNIPNKFIDTLIENIKKKDFNNQLFDDILDQVLVNISDTYNRFIISDMYKKLIKVDSLFGDIQ